MGKAALFFVAASMIAVTLSYVDSSITGLETEQQQINYEEQVLAREIAQSAFDLTVGKSRRDFTSYRPSRSGVIYRNGAFDAAVTGPSSGPLAVSVTGYYGSASHSISGTLIRAGETYLEPLIVEGSGAEAISTSGSSFLVSGFDANQDGSAAEGPDANGARFISATGYASAMDEFEADEIMGKGTLGNAGVPDIVQGLPDVDIDLIAGAIEAHESVQILDGDQSWSGIEEFGTVDDPAYIVVNGDLTIGGNVSGVGALLVNGSLLLSGSPRWEGLIIVEANGGTTTLAGSDAIYGSIILRDASASGSSDGGDAGGDDDSGSEEDGGDGADSDSDDGADSDSDDGADSDSDDGADSDSDDGGDSDSDGGDDSDSDGDDDGGSGGDGEEDGGDSGESENTTICHYPPGNTSNFHTLTVGSPAIAAHLAHGDSEGSCTGDVASSFLGTPAVGISGGVLAAGLSFRIPHQLLFLFNGIGAFGPKVDICHIPPGNPSNAHTISVSENAVPAHMAHGDTDGECGAASDDDGDDAGDDSDDAGDDDDGGGDDAGSDDAGDDDDGDSDGDSDDADDDDDGGSDDTGDDDEGSGDDPDDDGGSEAGDDAPDDDPEPFGLDISGSMQIIYSSAALRRLDLGVVLVAEQSAILLRNVRDTAGSQQN